MLRYLPKSILLLTSTLVVICGIYPLTLWIIGQIFFPFQAEGSLLKHPNGQLIGSLLIAQPFTKDEYFQPRPSAASYEATASTSSGLAASNYALRDRVARTIGLLAKYQKGPKAGALVAPDIQQWFSQDHFKGQPHIVAQWATLHNFLAQAWVNADPSHGAYVDEWIKSHPVIVAQFIKDNPNIPTPKATNLAIVFFQNFSKENPGKFPLDNTQIPSFFFDMWRQEYPNIQLQTFPGDYVTTSASGLDPHISFQNAQFQLDRIVAKWAANLKRKPEEIEKEIYELLEAKADAPLNGLIGERFINVLEVNLELNKRYGTIPG